jgi:hypothetical protein
MVRLTLFLLVLLRASPTVASDEEAIITQQEAFYPKKTRDSSAFVLATTS